MGFYTLVFVKLDANIVKNFFNVDDKFPYFRIHFQPLKSFNVDVGNGLPYFCLVQNLDQSWKTFNVCNGLPYSCLGQNLGQSTGKSFSVGNGLLYSCLSQILGQPLEKLQ